MSDGRLESHAAEVRRTNRKLCDALSKVSSGVESTELALLIASIQFTLVTNSAVVAALEDELGRVSGELEFRRSLDDVGADGE